MERQQHLDEALREPGYFQPKTPAVKHLRDKSTEFNPAESPDAASEAVSPEVSQQKTGSGSAGQPVVQYSRKAVPSLKQQQQAANAQHLQAMKEYFAEVKTRLVPLCSNHDPAVRSLCPAPAPALLTANGEQVDEFELAEETPTKQPAKPSSSPQSPSPEMTDRKMMSVKAPMSADRRTADWITALSPVMESDEGTPSHKSSNKVPLGSAPDSQGMPQLRPLL